MHRSLSDIWDQFVIKTFKLPIQKNQDYTEYMRLKNKYGFAKAKLRIHSANAVVSYNSDEYIKDPDVIRILFKSDKTLIGDLDKFLELRKSLKKKMTWYEKALLSPL